MSRANSPNPPSKLEVVGGKHRKNMKIEQVELYKKKYKGIKMAFNSRKGVGRIIEGIATQVVESEGLIILRDYDNFPHVVSILTLEEI